MKIKLLCVSDSDKHFDTAIAEYAKRLGSSVTVVTIKPQKHGSREQIIEKETDRIIEKLSNTQALVIMLTIQGQQYTTEQLSKQIAGKAEVVCIIGGPYGCNEERLRQYIDKRRSFGKQTMPHGLVKLVLMEQLYRIETLMIGKKYHY